MYKCCLFDEPRTFEWCEGNCEKYYHCDTVAAAMDMNMGDMAAKLGYSKSYLSQVEVGKIPPSLGLLEKYIDVFNLDASKAYSLFITAYENFDQITIDMNKLRILNREEFSRLLAIIKFFDPKVDKYEIEAHNLRDAINAIWKLSMP